MATATAELKNGKTKFDKEIAPLLKADKRVSVAVDAGKESKDLEKAAAAWDKALAAKDGTAMRSAYADLSNAAKTWRGKLNAANVKLQAASKKEANNTLKEALEDAGGALATLSGVAFMIEQTAHSGLSSASGGSGADLPATSFLGDWKSAKKVFEALTGKKKPSEGFLSAFRKSSGLEKAITAMDAASKKNDAAAFGKAFVAFDKAADDYLALCQKQAGVAIKKTDADIDGDAMEEADYKTALGNLLKGLNGIRAEAKEIADEAKRG